MESRFEIKRVVAAVHGKPEERALNYAVLRSMQKAIYSPAEEGHYALHSEHYCHFTSPIRRYPDLTVHRLLDDLARRRRPAEKLDALALMADHCSEREQRAQQAERELTKVKLLMYLSTRIGDTLEAVVTGVEQFGLFAQGVKLPAEGLIHIDSLTDDFYRFDPDTHTLEGHRAGKRYRLGDLLRVEIARVDVDGRELDLRLIERLHAADAPARSRKKKHITPSSPGRERTGRKPEKKNKRRR
jgi:ribonuclease R